MASNVMPLLVQMWDFQFGRHSRVFRLILGAFFPRKVRENPDFGQDVTLIPTEGWD
jgi:hypothetical protein